MSLPRSEVTTNRDDAAGGDTLGFMSMIGSTLNLNGRQDSCQHRPNSSNADGSSNSQAGGQEVELRDDSVSGGGVYPSIVNSIQTQAMHHPFQAMALLMLITVKIGEKDGSAFANQTGVHL